MKYLGLLAVIALGWSLPHGPALAAEGCVRPFGGPCISGPRPDGEPNTCKTRVGSCRVDLPKGAACRCRGVKGSVR